MSLYREGNNAWEYLSSPQRSSPPIPPARPSFPIFAETLFQENIQSQLRALSEKIEEVQVNYKEMKLLLEENLKYICP
jgi:hypothetical protein